MSYIWNKTYNSNGPKILNGMKLNHMAGLTFPIEKVDFSDCTDFSYMFYQNGPMQTPPAYNGTIEPTTAQYMFAGCAYLKNVPYPIDLTGLQTEPVDMFAGCNNLYGVDFVGVLKYNIDLSASEYLSQTTLNSLAWTLEDGATHNVTFKYHNAIRTKLAEHVRINSTGDGLEVCNPGDDGDLGQLDQYIYSKGWTIYFN